MSVDTQSPFRLDIDDFDDAWTRPDLLEMNVDAPVRLTVYSVLPDGTRVVSATVAEFTVMYRCSVTAREYSMLELRASEYNDDPAAGWERMTASLAADHVGLIRPVEPVGSPYRLLAFRDLALYPAVPPASPLRVLTGRGGHIAQMVRPQGYHVLYSGPYDPTTEVERFNQDPAAGMAQLYVAAVAERMKERQGQLRGRALEQVRDIRRARAALRNVMEVTR